MSSPPVESTTLVPVAPARPIAPYLGGKRMLARRLTALIDGVPHKSFIDVFAGMGGVFLRRTSRPKLEVINDLSRDVSNLFRILQRHPQALVAELARRVTSRDEFHRLRDLDPDTLTDLERADRFIYLQACAFGGKVTGRNFGVDATAQGSASYDARRVAARIDALHARLAGVVIERLPWEQLLPRYDRPHALFYLDPPYWGCETDYGEGLFAREDFERIAEALARLRGRFILSLNDRPEVRRIFARFEVAPVELSYGITGKGQTAARELIITGGG